MRFKKVDKNQPYISVDQKILENQKAHVTQVRRSRFLPYIFVGAIMIFITILIYEYQKVQQTISQIKAQLSVDKSQISGEASNNSNDINGIVKDQNDQVINKEINVKPQQQQRFKNGLSVGNYTVKQRMSRDQKFRVYTQGLVFANETTLIESAGMYGQSSIHSIEVSDPSKISVMKPIQKTFFGEGCDIINNDVYQLTWQENTMQIIETKNSLKHNLTNLEHISSLSKPIQMNSGWGITHRNHKGQNQIFLTDGSNKVYWAHDNFTIFRTTQLQYADKSAAINLNELEYANGLLYINIYTTSWIIAVDIDEGQIKHIYDLSELRQQVLETVGYEQFQYDNGNCLNGIAYHAKNASFWVTGKYWPYFWEIQFE